MTILQYIRELERLKFKIMDLERENERLEREIEKHKKGKL